MAGLYVVGFAVVEVSEQHEIVAAVVAVWRL